MPKTVKKKQKKSKKYSVRAKIAWMWDMDYLDELSAREKAFLLKFCDEFYHGAVKRTRVPGQIHKTRKQIKELYRANNSRNRDLMNEYRLRYYAARHEGGKITQRPQTVRVHVPSEITFKKFKG